MFFKVMSTVNSEKVQTGGGILTSLLSTIHVTFSQWQHMKTGRTSEFPSETRSVEFSSALLNVNLGRKVSEKEDKRPKGVSVNAKHAWWTQCLRSATTTSSDLLLFVAAMHKYNRYKFIV